MLLAALRRSLARSSANIMQTILFHRLSDTVPPPQPGGEGAREMPLMAEKSMGKRIGTISRQISSH